MTKYFALDVVHVKEYSDYKAAYQTHQLFPTLSELIHYYLIAKENIGKLDSEGFTLVNILDFRRVYFDD